MKNWLMTLFTIIGLQSAVVNAENAFDHSSWNDLLQQNVHLLNGGQASQVDYQGFADDRTSLKRYLDRLAKVNQTEFDSWPKDDQLAFLINSYNAWTVELILTKWPDLDSIKDLGSLFSSPWSKKIVTLLGEKRSLDEVEHTLIRGSDRYNDPRIHFAVNCASIGCPALANQAFQGDNLDSLLETQTELFLADSSRNRLNGKKLELSSIFKWYREDFEKGWKGYDSLEDFISNYASFISLPERVKTALDNKKVDIKFLDYDWALNKKS
ncbi:hypothetical protein MUS1_01340 [Marinomonas ushuaiensis DSM 15871]|uniref:DUF547 domain-containing protein n=1 Tax=Marinomonas ushuaiensis DSM 15871 TaxID=1122207 RepID=X7EAY7_9GAMM|nr:DUF547 domain-containing protein [Marinomonas ushuaiensis]ETX12278.1 hypothetical protein MUS1_01340 [Marinomonas ushuaiensis DSM 15871]